MNQKSADWQSVCEWSFLALGFLVLFALPHDINGDGMQRFQALEALVHGAFTGTKYSIIGPFFALPLFTIGTWFGNPAMMTGYFNVIVLLCGVASLAFTLRGRLPGPMIRSFLLVLVFGSMLPDHTRHFYGEVFTAVAVAGGIASVVVAGNTGGWIWTVLGVANTPMTLPGYGLLLLHHCWNRKRLRYVLLGVAALACILLEARLRRGGFFDSGYMGEQGKQSVLPYTDSKGFQFPFFIGFLSLTLSFGKGIVFYAPGLLLSGAWLRAKANAALIRLYALWLWYLLGILLVVSVWYSWQGGWFWGPRFLLFASFPASLALAGYLRRVKSFGGSILALLFLLLSFWVGFSGLIFNQRDMGLCLEDNARLEPLCWYAPEYSALLRPFVTGTVFHLQPGELLLALIWTGAFICTAWPVLVQLRSHLQKICRKAWSSLDLRHWRF